MSESNYQAVYDAVRSRISNGDVGAAIMCAVREANLSHYADMIHRGVEEAASEYTRPSVLMRPALSVNLAGDAWYAGYGDVVGQGASPSAAMRAFDDKWYGREA